MVDDAKVKNVEEEKETEQTDVESEESGSEPLVSVEGQEFEMVGGVACPIDPMERLQCESCQ